MVELHMNMASLFAKPPGNEASGRKQRKPSNQCKLLRIWGLGESCHVRCLQGPITSRIEVIRSASYSLWTARTTCEVSYGRKSLNLAANDVYGIRRKPKTDPPIRESSAADMTLTVVFNLILAWWTSRLPLLLAT